MKYTVLFYPFNQYPNILNDIYRKLQKSARSKIARQLSYLELHGLDTAVIDLKKLRGHELWEVRILGKENIRIFVRGAGQYIFVLHIFQKKSQDTHLKDIHLAMKRWKEITKQIY